MTVSTHYSHIGTSQPERKRPEQQTENDKIQKVVSMLFNPFWILMLCFTFGVSIQSLAQDCEGDLSPNLQTICQGTENIQLTFTGNGTSSEGYDIRIRDINNGVNLPIIPNLSDGSVVTIDVNDFGGNLPGTYTLRLNLVRSTNLSCTEITGNIDEVTIVVEPTPEVAAIGGDSGGGNSALICNGETTTDIQLSATAGVNVDYVVTSATPTNVNGLTSGTVIGNSGGTNNPVDLPAPSLIDPNLSGEIIYEITPQSAGPNGMLGDMDDCDGTPIMSTITIEPIPVSFLVFRK